MGYGTRHTLTCTLITLAVVAYYLHTLHVHTMYTCFTCSLLACAILPHYLHTPYVHTMYTCFTCALSTPTLLADYLHALCRHTNNTRYTCTLSMYTCYAAHHFHALYLRALRVPPSIMTIRARGWQASVWR